jgi:hypothetical protein
VVDPGFGRRLVTWSELRTAFTGIAITLEPAAGFTSEERRRSGLGRYLRQLLRESSTLGRVLGASVLLQALALALPFPPDGRRPRGAARRRPAPGDARAGTGGHRGVHFLPRSPARGCSAPARAARLADDVGLSRHLVDLPYSFFQQRSTGDLMERLNSNATVRESSPPAHSQARSTACWSAST